MAPIFLGICNAASGAAPVPSGVEKRESIAACRTPPTAPRQPGEFMKIADVPGLFVGRKPFAKSPPEICARRLAWISRRDTLSCRAGCRLADRNSLPALELRRVGKMASPTLLPADVSAILPDARNVVHVSDGGRKKSVPAQNSTASRTRSNSSFPQFGSFQRRRLPTIYPLSTT